MRIKQVSLQNFKGITAEHRLEPVTIITGGNCTGKTAVALALKLGLSGALPVIGKSAQAIYKLAGRPDDPGEMVITLLTDPAGVIQHRWTRNEKGTVSYAGALPPDVAWPEAMLDFRRFLSLPGADQAAEVFARCRTTAKPQDFLESLDQITGSRPEIVQEVAQEVRDTCTAPMPLAGWIEDALTTVKAKASAAASDEKRASSALQLHVRNQPTRAEDVGAQLAAAEAELSRSTEAIARHANAWRRYEREFAEWKARAQTWESGRELLAENFENDMGTLSGRLANVEAMKCCPTCGAAGDGWSGKMLDVIRADMAAKERDYKALFAVHMARKPTDKAPAKPEQTPTAARDRMIELQAQVGELRSKQAYFNGSREWKSRRDELEAQAADATCRAQTWKEVKKRLEAWRDAQINAGVGAIVDTANRFAHGLLDSDLAWHPERMEFGRWRDKGWVSLDCFSGFEEQLAFAALSVAVANQTRVKLVIMDELGRLKARNKVAVVTRMYELVAAGVIDQFVGIDVEAGDYRGFEGWKNVRFIEL